MLLFCISYILIDNFCISLRFSSHHFLPCFCCLSFFTFVDGPLKWMDCNTPEYPYVYCIPWNLRSNYVNYLKPAYLLAKNWTQCRKRMRKRDVATPLSQKNRFFYLHHRFLVISPPSIHIFSNGGYHVITSWNGCL